MSDRTYSDFARKQHRSYRAQFANHLDLREPGNRTPSHPGFMRRLAIAWQNARHAPSDPVVALNYERFAGETLLQFQLLESAGIRFEPTDDIAPYDHPDQLARDLDKRRAVRIWTGGDIQADHPLAQRGRVPGHPGWRVLDALRGVHEVFGHAVGNSFRTAEGEEAAFRSHLATYSVASWPSLTVEFRAPLAWLLHGPHLTKRDASLPWDQRPYPPQKAVALPVELWSHTIHGNE